jgi:polyisoprenoid-binding protein YceI
MERPFFMSFFKTNFSTIAAVAILSSVTSFSAMAAEALIPGTYKVDADHSKVGFGVKHLVISTVDGRFGGFDGEFVVGKKIDDTKISATVNTSTVDTGVAKRDAHLKGPDFFNSDKFPKMTFKSKKVSGSPEKLKIVGDLTIKDITREVSFDGQYLGAVKDPWGNERVGVEAVGKINRKDFGLTYGKVVEKGPVIGDDVTISLAVEGIKNSK